MSAIEKELSKATGVEAKRGEGRQDFLARLVIAVAKLPDADWGKLGKPAQTWFNDAADARNEKRDIAAFPDEAKEDAPARSGGRRKVEDEPEQRLTKVGDTATVTTKRGKVYVGEVTEISDDIIVLKGDDGEDEFDMDKVESIVVQNGGSSAAEDAPWEPAVGEKVVVTTKRGKKYEGEITELSDSVLVLKGDDGEDEFDMDKVGSVEPLGGAAPAADDDAPARRGAKEETASRRGAAKEDAPADKPKRASNPKGVSVGGRIREIMCEDMGITAADVGKILKKEAIDFRETTLDMIYKDTTTVFDLLKANKKLK